MRSTFNEKAKDISPKSIGALGTEKIGVTDGNNSQKKITTHNDRKNILNKTMYIYIYICVVLIVKKSSFIKDFNFFDL